MARKAGDGRTWIGRTLFGVPPLILLVAAMSCSSSPDVETASVQSVSEGLSNCNTLYVNAGTWSGTTSNPLYESPTLASITIPQFLTTSGSWTGFASATLTYQGGLFSVTCSYSAHMGYPGEVPQFYFGNCSNGATFGQSVVSNTVLVTVTTPTGWGYGEALLPYTADDGNVCTLDVCTNGAVQPHQAVANDTIVTDGNLCQSEMCENGVISATPITPPPNDSCTTYKCDPKTGVYGTPTGSCLSPPGIDASAPPSDPTLPTDFAQAMASLYTDGGIPNPSIDTTRVAVLRGRALDLVSDPSTPIANISISVHKHPEFGTVLTRSDGWFDIAVNGGTSYVLDYTQAVGPNNYLPVQRHAEARWHDYTVVEDTYLVRASTGTAITMGNAGSNAWQMVTGPTTTAVMDKGCLIPNCTSGAGLPRTPRVLIPPGTYVASAVDGTGAPVSWTAPATPTLRFTEFTVGGQKGWRAMPGELPPQSMYSYAFDLGLQDADAAGLYRITFNQPVIVYVDNFTGQPVNGTDIVPVGTYDRVKGIWTPEPENGIIVTVVASSVNGQVSLSLDGNNEMTSNQYAANNISVGERTQLNAAGLSVSKSYWRVRAPHFSDNDWNWAGGLSNKATPPPSEPPSVQPHLDPCSPGVPDTVRKGSIIECENQVLGEDTPIVGTPYSLHYSSAMQKGAYSRITIPIVSSMPDPTSGFLGALVVMDIAGAHFEQVFNVGMLSANQRIEVGWDRRNGAGQLVQGTQTATGYINYVYQAATTNYTSSFGATGGTTVTSVREGRYFLWSRRFSFPVTPSLDAQPLGLGGWTISAHHVYEPTTGTVWMGNGGVLSSIAAGHNQAVLTTVFGEAPDGYGGYSSSVAVGADGTVYGTHYSGLSSNDYLFKVTSATIGTPLTRTDNGPSTFVDGAALSSISVHHPTCIIALPDDNLLLCEPNRLIRIGSGVTRPITLIAGTRDDTSGNSNGDGTLAVNATFPAAITGAALAADGSILFSTGDSGTGIGRVRRIAPDGKLQTVLGTNSTGTAVDKAYANQSAFYSITSVAAGPDGSFYAAEPHSYTVWQVTTDGILHRFAGNGSGPPPFSEGALANTTRIEPTGLAYFGGTLYITDYNHNRVYKVVPDTGNTGLIYTAAGNGGTTCIDGIPAAGPTNSTSSSGVKNPIGVGIGLDGSIFVTQFGACTNGKVAIRKFRTSLGTTTTGGYLVPSMDGSEVYKFDGRGQHQQTLSGLRGQPIVQFQHDSNGRLTSILDPEGRSTVALSYPNASTVTVVAQAPGYTNGHTTTLSLVNGYLASVADPNGGSASFTYDALDSLHPGKSLGRLLTMTDPNSYIHKFAYDYSGLLLNDTDPLPGSIGTSLARHVGYTVDPNTNHVSWLSGTTEFAIKSPEGWMTDHIVNVLPDSTSPYRLLKRTVTDPLSLAVTTEARSDGTTTQSQPDGTTVVSTQGPDPRFSWNLPITAQSVLSTGSHNGMAAVTITKSRAATLAQNAVDVMGLATETDTTTIVPLNAQYVRTFNATASPATITSTSPMNRSVITTLDTAANHLDRIKKISVPGSIPGNGGSLYDVNLTYDSNTGRLATVTQGARSSTVAYNYTDMNGTTDFAASVTTPFGTVLYPQRDKNGRATQVSLPGLPSNLLNLGYDAKGNATFIRPPKGNQHNFAPNGVDLLATYDPPQVSPAISPLDTSYTYDRDSLLQQLIEPSTGNATVSYTYDAGTRINGFSHPSATVSFVYDPTTGHLTSANATNAGQQFVNLGYAYDGALLTSETYTSGESRLNNQVVSYDYDGVLRPAHRSINGGNTLTYAYDNDSVISTITSGTATYTVNRGPGTGLVSSTTLGSVVDCYSYDQYGSVIAYAACTGSCNATATDATCTGTTFYHVQYGREPATGRITSKTESSRDQNNATTNRSWTYTYTSPGNPANVAANQLYQTGGSDPRTETYDVNGNIAPGSRTYDAQDRMTNYGWNLALDNNGNTITQQSGGSTMNFGYDPLGNLRSYSYVVNQAQQASSSNYLIDARNRRVAKTHPSDPSYFFGYLYDDSNRIIARLDGNGLEAQYAYVTKGNVPDVMVKSGIAYRIISDQIGSPRVIVSSTGVVLESVSYSTWGIPTPYAPTSMPFGFAGGLWDSDLGLERFGARDYNVWGQRWWSKDPSGFNGGVNLYRYSNNDPVNYIDPDGHHPLLVVLVLAAAYLALNMDSHDTPQGTEAAIGAANMLAEGLMQSWALDYAFQVLRRMFPFQVVPMGETGSCGSLPGDYLASKAPKQVTPGVKVLEGQYVNDLGRVEPWRAHYDDYGRLIGRTDFNAGNPTAGIPDTHYHIYDWSDMNHFRTIDHIPGEY